MRRWTINGLYAVTPDISDTQTLLEKVSLALQGGASIVQYRNKSAAPELKNEQSRALRKLCRSFDVPLIINDDVELADRIDAGGVHLGREDTAVHAARALLGSGKMIGASCYDDIALAGRAVREGADYIAFGSFFLTMNKRDAVNAPLNVVAEAKQRFGVPVVAIGGIRLENAPEIVAAGADAIAVISGLFDEPDIAAAARGFVQLFENVA
jgi:thiamine-phosphate pyrophosphorylase